MARFTIKVVATRAMTPEQIREEYGDILGDLDENSDPVDSLVEYFDDENDVGNILDDEGWTIEATAELIVEKKKK